MPTIKVIFHNESRESFGVSALLLVKLLPNTSDRYVEKFKTRRNTPIKPGVLE
jgi:hypothetical protein